MSDTSAAQREWSVFVDGAPLRTQADFAVESPSSGREIARVPDCTEADVDAAVVAAEQAQVGWSALLPRVRASKVRELADHLLDHKDELASLDSLDLGSPFRWTRFDVESAAELMNIFADYALELGGRTMPLSSNLHFTTNEPYGVVARIGAFNHPFFFAAAKVAAPLIAGNAVVLKAPAQTPLSTLRLAELAADVLPPNLLISLSGRGRETGRALVRHPAVRRIGFIGSEATGRAIQIDAAESGVKHVSLELGGKNAQIVMPDADLEAAARAAVDGMNFLPSSGQSCGSTSRLLLHRSIADQVANRVAELLSEIRVGDPFDEATDMGPVVSRNQYESALHYIDAGVSEGGRLLAGGARPASVGAEGWYLEPTLISDVDPRSTLGQEEVFGPVLAAMTFENEQDAIRIANDVPFGLTGSVWSRDIGTALRTARALHVGHALVNSHSRHFWGLPFGGVKASGTGREESLEELLSYTEPKATTVVI